MYNKNLSYNFLYVIPTLVVKIKVGNLWVKD